MQAMNKILPGHKYVANFLDAPVEIGSIFRMDDKQFIPAIHFNDAYPDINLARLIKGGTKGAIRFTEQKNVSISLGGNGTTGIGESEVKLRFHKSKSVAGVIENAVTETIRFENILAELKEIWTKRGYSKFWREYIFVYDVVTAESGTLIYSKDSNNEVVLKHKLGAALTKVADLGSGNFEFVSNTKRTLEIIRNVAHKPLFKAFHLRKKTWEPEILG